jgi:trans-aconitate 2-methyltransferase
MGGVRWDPQQYGRYADERSRSFFELLARIGVTQPRTVVDLGCGPGPLTAALAERWPDARVVGVDSSADMMEAAAAYAVPGRVEFIHADVAGWRPEGSVDVVIANAVLQWVRGHLELVPGFASWLAVGGAFAFQVPDNFTEPSHTLLLQLRTSSRWREQLGEGADRTAGVERPETYLAALQQAGLDADVWQTTYLHVLHGDDPVLEWVKGSALRPVLSILDEADRAEFLADYAAALRAAYPPTSAGTTVFPFRRTFAVGTNVSRGS